MRGGSVEIALYLSCLNFILNLYAGFITLLGVLSHFLAFILISCVIFGILLRYRVSKPKASLVKSFFGKEWEAFTSYEEDKVDDINSKLKVIAHRACGLDSPENTLAALKAVHKEGIKAVEFDIRLTADEVPIVFHDENTTRLSNVDFRVSDVTYDEIKNIDISVKHPFGKNFPGEKIATLHEYIKFCLENDIRMIMDLKVTNEKIVKIITDLYKQYPKLYEFNLVSSFNAVTIYKIRAKDPNIISSLAWRPYYFSHEEYSAEKGPTGVRTSNFFVLMFLKCINVTYEWALWKFGYYVLGLSALLLHKDMVNWDTIIYWKKRGIQIIAWNVNLPTEKQYFEKMLGVTYLTDTAINS